MTQTQPEPPVEIRLIRSRTCLRLVWEDGLMQEIDAATLRAGSPSAGAKRLRIDGIQVPVADDTAITDLRLLGRYGVNLIFSDGHDRGIYPWALLRDLAGATTCAQSDAAIAANAIP